MREFRQAAERFDWIDADARHAQQHRLHVTPISRAPAAVLAERDATSAAELTPNMAVLGDPLPGRSALDAKQRAS
jgi:hypothetical protein